MLLLILMASLVVNCQGFLTLRNKSGFLFDRFGNKKLSHQDLSIKIVGEPTGRGLLGWFKSSNDNVDQSQLILNELKILSKKQDEISDALKVVKTKQDKMSDDLKVVKTKQDEMSDDLKVVKTKQDEMSLQVDKLEGDVNFLRQDRGPTIELAVRSQLVTKESSIYARSIHVKRLKSSLSFFGVNDCEHLPNEPKSSYGDISGHRERKAAREFLVLIIEIIILIVLDIILFAYLFTYFYLFTYVCPFE